MKPRLGCFTWRFPATQSKPNAANFQSAFMVATETLRHGLLRACNPAGWSIQDARFLSRCVVLSMSYLHCSFLCFLPNFMKLYRCYVILFHRSPSLNSLASDKNKQCIQHPKRTLSSGLCTLGKHVQSTVSGRIRTARQAIRGQPQAGSRAADGSS